MHGINTLKHYMYKYRIFIIFLCLCTVQIILLQYWYACKTNYYIDEYFSLECAKYFTKANGSRQYLCTEILPNNLNNWMNVGELQDNLYPLKEELLSSHNFLFIISKLFSERPYRGIINLLFSLCKNDISIWFVSDCFNVFIWVITEIIIFYILYKLTDNIIPSFLTISFLSGSGLIIGLISFVRMYIWDLFLWMLILFLHLIIWKELKTWRVIIELLGVLLFTYIALKDSEPILIIFAVLLFVYSIMLLVFRKCKIFFIYFGGSLFAGVYYILTSKFLWMLNAFFSGKNNISEGHVKDAIDSLSSLDFRIIIGGIVRLIGWIRRYVFSLYSLTIITVLTVIFFLICLLKQYVQKKNIEHEIAENDGFALILFCVGIISALANICVSFREERYYIYSIVTIFISVAYIIYRGISMLKLSHSIRKGIGIGYVLLIIICTFVRRDIPYLYEEDEIPLQMLSEYSSYDALLIHDLELMGSTDIYECIYYREKTASVYPTKWKELNLDVEKFPEQFLVWTHLDADISGECNMLVKEGYTLTPLCSTHGSDVYIAER